MVVGRGVTSRPIVLEDKIFGGIGGGLFAFGVGFLEDFFRGWFGFGVEVVLQPVVSGVLVSLLSADVSELSVFLGAEVEPFDEAVE